MRLLAYASAAILIGVACASSEDENMARAPEPKPDAGLPPSDASTRDSARGDELEPPTCSAAGWCITALPDVDLVLKDIWPLPGRAFAVGESPTVGIKFLEWEDASATWKYIDDSTQNASAAAKYAGRLWAPGENEVYFTVAPATVYHGTRESPSSSWSWTNHRLEDNHPGHPYHDHGYPMYRQLSWDFQSYPYPALGVWGTGPKDVYAWYSNSIFHWKSIDGGVPTWVAEHVVDDFETTGQDVYVLGAAGESTDDVWFSMARTSGPAACAILVRKTGGQYRRIADGSATAFDCEERPGLPKVGGTEGWLTDLQVQSTNRLVGLKGARDVVQILVDGEDVSYVAVPVPSRVAPRVLASLWSGPDDHVWLSGWGLVVRGTDLSDGGAFEVSTISLNGAPLNRPMYRVRGISNDNLWAIGVRHAFHKTTP